MSATRIESEEPISAVQIDGLVRRLIAKYSIYPYIILIVSIFFAQTSRLFFFYYFGT